MKKLIIITILYLSGILQLFILGDYTHSFYQVTGIQEDSKIITQVLDTRWQIVHLIETIK